MSTIDEWWNSDEPDDSIAAASDCIVKRVNADTGEIEIVGVIPARKADMQPGETLAGMRSQRHAGGPELQSGTVVG